MKVIALSIGAAAALGFAIAEHADAVRSQRTIRFAPGCVVQTDIAPKYLPRAGILVENIRFEPVRIWLEAREGSGLDRVELGAANAGELRFFGHVLPAGRNVLMAGDGQPRPWVITVVNRGAETCARRYRLRVE